ncbi:hypothetical protein DFP72DRAFT_1166108 [Ephemerocybe angulata]|uniref:Uncharacterized protein n=1 Tax=Ephemerocybe angulata TaxID=980116 RepID=A0A8H6MDX4_9AGAR|nr:hypothetical protein DFP72DRAFT_1166108 [Tulosesus angulatus]
MKTLFYIISFLSVLSSIAALGSPPNIPTRTVHRRQTNAQRMSRGLPPLPPRHLFSPTRPIMRRSAVSAVPGSTILINIGVESLTTGETSWYLRAGGGLNNNGPSPFTITAPASSSAKFELTSAEDTERRLVLIHYQDVSDFGSDPAIGLHFQQRGGDASTPAGSGPHYDMDGTTFESTVWSLDSTTGVLSATWIRASDSSEIPLRFVLRMWQMGIWVVPVIDYQAFVDADSVNYQGASYDEVRLVASPPPNRTR